MEERTSKSATQIADEMILAAKAHVNQMLLETESYIQNEVNQARSYGIAEGEAEALELQDRISKLEIMMGKEVLKDVFTMSMEVAQAVIKQSLKMHLAEALAYMAQKALESVPSGTQVTLRVSSQDAHVFSNPEAFSMLSHPYEIRPDPEIESGGLILQTSVGVLDAQPKTQMEELLLLLLERFAQHGTGD